MYKKFFFLLFVSVVTVAVAENFIVQKAKQMVVSYDDQWCALFAKVMEACADYDREKSFLQKNGIKEIIELCESDSHGSFAQLPAEHQKELVVELQKVYDQLHKAQQSVSAYNRKQKTLFIQAAKNKKS